VAALRLKPGRRPRAGKPRAGKPEGRILAPTNRERLAQEFSVAVALSAIPAAYHVWIAVQVGNLFWPKNPEVRTRDQKWIRKLREVGLPRASLSLALLMVAATDHEKILRWFRDGLRSGEYPGFTKGSPQLNEVRLDIVRDLVLE
jgi:hypothetical protein